MIVNHQRTTAFLITLVALLSLATVAGCAADEDKETPAAVASHYSGEDCDSLLEGTKPASFTDEKGTKLSGVVVGNGKTGFVLSHMDPGDVCDWLPFARELASAHPGYRLLCLDFAGYGNSDSPTDGDRRDLNIAAAARYLRDQGATTVLLMGASMGGNSALVAATTIQPPIAGVISLSAPAFYKGLDAGAAVPKLAVPVLYLAGSGDNGGSFADDAQRLYDTTPASLDRQLVITASTSHGVNLLSPVDADASHSRGALTAFMDKYAPAG
jgi:pimeloyl-ACP methyl ester carboxylesterase